jgi:uncharacterized protein
MKCFYHSADLDGKCSAAIVQRKWPEIELIGINYGQDFPWDDVERDEINGAGLPLIAMVDFSLQPFDDMLRLREMTPHVIWIDHHKSALEEADAAGWTTIEGGRKDVHPTDNPLCVAGLRRVGIGACVLTWEYLFPNEPVPRAVQLLGEYDVWDHSDPDCLPFQYGARSESLEADHPMWVFLLGDESAKWVDSITKAGKTIMKHQAGQNTGHARTLCFDAELDGLNLLVANAGPTNSQFFDSKYDPEKYHAMCLFQWRPKGNSWTVSLYSDRDDVDVSKVCKARGGGGHKGAAGFQCVDLPFTLGGEAS